MRKFILVPFAFAVAAWMTADWANAEPPSGLKKKASRLGDELEMLNKGEMEEAKERSNEHLELLKKNRTYEAEKARRARWNKERREREAAKRAKEEAAKKAAARKAARRRARKAVAKSVKRAGGEKTALKDRKGGEAKIDREAIRKRAAERRKLRKLRTAKRRKELRRELREKFGDKAPPRAYVKGLVRHERRQARLLRVQEIAAAKGDQEALQRVATAIDKENARHEKWTKKWAEKQGGE